ncbi:hypothetical protein HNP84_001261 [Thermocatellispora tengchongensis]|uniref:Acyltransferase 3 domain-containing protein n=1 Tax=Thermocatellispora tengchongensis TaxID=1073253 RepID=A0A840P6B9_9ACTN|nr:acyltransferase [Thermocatellispora tengchongensis]MBB5131555.1 hypothetical protein [Thermocatellispora tengchongensis]
MTVLLERPAPALAPAPAPVAVAGRDVFVDALRLFGMALVILQHWSMPVLSFADGRIVTGNALAAPGVFAVTWISQVMPLVFFAGGAANAIGLRARGGAYLEAGPVWLAQRLRRLAWPVLALGAVWVPLPHALLALGLPEQPVEVGARLTGQLLWFLAAYLIAVALSPVLLRAHERYGARVPAVLAAGAVAVDLLRFGTGLEWLGYLNVACVWLAVHQIGFLYADGRITRPLLLVAGGYGAALLLVAAGPYPGSMIGLPGAPVSNMAPPTLALLAVGIGQIGLALLLRPLIVRARWLRPALGWAGPRIMTAYLWHMPALVAVAGVVVVGLGVSTPEPGGAAWAALWPLWLGLLGLVLWPLLRGLARFERPPAVPYGPLGWPGALAAAALVGAGLLTLTVAGFAPGLAPVAGMLAIGAGLLLTVPRL